MISIMYMPVYFFYTRMQAKTYMCTSTTATHTWLDMHCIYIHIITPLRFQSEFCLSSSNISYKNSLARWVLKEDNNKPKMPQASREHTVP